jgi:integrative and conjugative element protein (TIGR02256 family)
METLVLARRAADAAAGDCLEHPDTETGGILAGHRTDGAFLVPMYVPAGPNARRSPHGFAPDHRWQQYALDMVFLGLGLDYVGDLHRHPGAFDRPSTHDRDTARRIVMDPVWNTRAAVFPIAVIIDGHVRFRAYRMTRDEGEFLEIPIEIVPDSDPRIRNLLVPTEGGDDEACRHSRCLDPRCVIRRAVGRLRSLQVG